MNESQNSWIFFKSAVLLSIVIGIIYSNTLHCPWVLDDYQNIQTNPKIHLTVLDKNAILNSFYAAPGNKSLSRPVAFFSFALNWFFGKDRVEGYHIVNICIHILTAIFLFLTIVLLFKTPNLSITGWKEEDVHFVAMLTAVLWAINPIQIEAVTYIVQRMASMAALFYIIGMFCYLRARLTASTFHRAAFGILCAVSFLLAIGTKSNAIMLPVFLVVLEFVFFRDLTQKKTQRQAVAIIVSLVVVVMAAGVLLFMHGNPANLLGGYKERSFTLYQRLLTQPRIVMFYLSQIFYPIANRFSITHDFTLSVSLFHPWTTLPSILTIALLIGLALWRVRKNPVFSFAILFFFGNHVIESTIIPLEMVFEHRNYLPSLFLFLPVSVGLKKVFDYYRQKNKPMYCFLFCAVCAMIIGISTSTYIRNYDWRSVKSIWEDAMVKDPHSARPLQNLAWGYYEPTGQVDKAIELDQRALKLQDSEKDSRFYSYNNLASIYLLDLKNYKKAVEYAVKALEIFPNSQKTGLILCNSLCGLGQYDQALHYLDGLNFDTKFNQNFMYLKGFILLRFKKNEKALDCFQRCLEIMPKNWKYLQAIGICLTRMGYNERGFWFLKQAEAIQPKQADVLIWLADNRMRAGHPNEAKKWVDALVYAIGADNIESYYLKLRKNPLGLPVSARIVPLISEKLREISEKYSQMAASMVGHFAPVQ